ncbi:hypothetical protein TNCV_1493551 [Trichonephila clavipes]|nr:hypothetical protein TNCV_1493551 [Trichonephila clavipes]
MLFFGGSNHWGIVWGKTVYRALKTSVVQPPNYPHIPPVPYHPAVSLEVNLSDTIPLPDTSQVAREVTAELLADFGVDIAAHVGKYKEKQHL